MTAPPYTSDDGHIVYGKCYASYVRSISDRDGDPDPYPDIDLLNGSVKFESVFDGAGARPALPLPAVPRTKGIVISGDTYEVKNSNLVDKENREGVWLIISVDGIPLTWRATVTLTDERNRVVLNASYIVTETIWEVELDGRKVVNLPDLIPNPGALTPVEGSALRAAQQTLDEIRVLKGLIDNTKLGVDASAGNALTYRNQARGFRDEAEGFKSTASTQAGIATTKAGESKGFRDEAEGFKSTASTQAGIATTKAGESKGFRDEAEGFKSTASTQAGIATTKAGESKGFRDEAEGFKNQALAARLSWKGAWNSSSAYVERDVVSHGGSSWWAKQPSTGVEPAEGATWSLVASKGEQGEGITDAADLTGALTDQVDLTSAMSHYANLDGGTGETEPPLSEEAAPLSILLGMGVMSWGQVSYLSDVLGLILDTYGNVNASKVVGELTSRVDASAATVPDPNTEFGTRYPLGTFVQEMATDVAILSSSLSIKADLDGSGKIPAAQMPALAITEFLGAVASQAAMLGLSGQRGDWCVRTDRNTQWILIADNPAVIGSWREMVTPAAPVSSVAGRTGAVTLSKSDVGLSAVDNTSDANKPISTAVSAALGTKAPSDHTHTPASIGAEPVSWSGTQAQYDALGPKDQNRTYNIIEG